MPEPFIANATLPFPGVFDLQDVGDIDADGIVDVLAMLVHYRMAAQTDACLLIVSGKTGEPIRWVNHSFTATQNVFWPADGIFQPNRDRYRSSGLFSFSGESPHRSGHRYPGDFFVRARRRSTTLRIAVPSPPQASRPRCDRRRTGRLANPLRFGFIESGLSPSRWTFWSRR